MKYIRLELEIKLKIVKNQIKRNLGGIKTVFY